MNENRWQYTFTHRFFPDYYQSYGLGFYEYFLLSEEMNAEPLPVLNCGLSCQYQNDDPKAHVAVCDLDHYIQDALDLIEFANGDVNTTWGKVRADMGHPAPFNLKFIGIGNFVAKGNPIIKYKYTADPGTMVYDGKVYIYAGHDECPPPKEHYLLNEWCVFSSPDMKTWTEHPVPLKAKDFGWAKGEAWASQVIERDGKFYWYGTVEQGTIPGKSIGVAVADSPIGPFTDARGSALVTNDMTTEYTKIGWDDIDPTVFIDDDGQAYLCWGKYPVLLCQTKKEHDCLNELAGNSNTNHQAIIEFKGDWYFIYHNGGINTAGGSFRRSVCIDRLYYNDDGTMKRIQMTSEGVQ